MPFDAAGFPSERGAPKRLPRDDDAATLIIVAIVLSLLIIPILSGVMVQFARAV